MKIEAYIYTTPNQKDTVVDRSIPVKPASLMPEINAFSNVIKVAMKDLIIDGIGQNGTLPECISIRIFCDGLILHSSRNITFDLNNRTSANIDNFLQELSDEYRREIAFTIICGNEFRTQGKMRGTKCIKQKD